MKLLSNVVLTTTETDVEAIIKELSDEHDESGGLVITPNNEYVIKNGEVVTKHGKQVQTCAFGLIDSITRVNNLIKECEPMIKKHRVWRITNHQDMVLTSTLYCGNYAITDNYGTTLNDPTLGFIKDLETIESDISVVLNAMLQWYSMLSSLKNGVLPANNSDFTIIYDTDIMSNRKQITEEIQKIIPHIAKTLYFGNKENLLFDTSYFESNYKEYISSKYPSFADKEKAGVIYNTYKLVIDNEELMRDLDKIAKKMDDNKNSVFDYDNFRIEPDSIAKSVAPLAESLTRVNENDPPAIVSNIISFENAANWKEGIPKLDIKDRKVINKIAFMLDLFL